jgi:hypothetical protein
MSADFVQYVAVAQGAAGTTVLAAGIAGKRHKVVSALLTLDANGTLKFTGTADLTGAFDIAQYGGFVIPATNYPQFAAEEGATLSIVTVAGAAKGVVGVVTE